MRIATILISLLVLTSCASNTEKEIYHEKMSQESHMSKDKMNKRILQMLDNSESLKPEQREKFLDLHSKVMHDVRGVNDELRRLKVVLFKNLSSGKYKRRKIDSIKKQIVTQYNKKLNIMFDALYETQKILGVGSRDFYQNEWFPVHFSL